MQLLLKASGLKYSMHSAGTTVEGSWDAVVTLIGRAHALLHAEGVVRVQSDVRIGTRYVMFRLGGVWRCEFVFFVFFCGFLGFGLERRGEEREGEVCVCWDCVDFGYRTDKHQSFEEKVQAVERILG